MILVDSSLHENSVVIPFCHSTFITFKGKGQYFENNLFATLSVLDDMIEDMAEQLKKAHDIEEFSHVALPTQKEVTVVGRICCDSNGKLNAKSVLLEGSVDMSAGKTIPVDLTQLKEYALFPGQVGMLYIFPYIGMLYIGMLYVSATGWIYSPYIIIVRIIFSGGPLGSLSSFLACLDEVQEELLYYPRRWHWRWRRWQNVKVLC